MIIDASVALMWLVSEAHSAKAMSLLSREDMAAPDIIDVELGQALTRRVRQRLLTPTEARRLWAETPRLPMIRIAWRDFADDAFDLSQRLRATFNDCVYLAMAINENAPLITADDRFVRSVETDRRLNGAIMRLADL